MHGLNRRELADYGPSSQVVHRDNAAAVVNQQQSVTTASTYRAQIAELSRTVTRTTYDVQKTSVWCELKEPNPITNHEGAVGETSHRNPVSVVESRRVRRRRLTHHQ